MKVRKQVNCQRLSLSDFCNSFDSIIKMLNDIKEENPQYTDVSLNIEVYGIDDIDITVFGLREETQHEIDTRLEQECINKESFKAYEKRKEELEKAELARLLKKYKTDE